MKILIASDDIPVVGPMLSALGMDTVFPISIPQGNKYEPHQGSKEKERRKRQITRGIIK